VHWWWVLVSTDLRLQRGFYVLEFDPWVAFA
jgi:hypothetical protein